MSDQKAAGKAQAEMIRNYQRVFGSELGQVVLRDMFRRFGFLTTSATSDPYQTMFNEGQRAVVTWLAVHQLKMDPDQILKHLQTMQDQQREGSV